MGLLNDRLDDQDYENQDSKSIVLEKWKKNNRSVYHSSIRFYFSELFFHCSILHMFFIMFCGVTDIHLFYYSVVAFYLFLLEFISQQHNTPKVVFKKLCSNY